jgi:hypothetical protein
MPAQFGLKKLLSDHPLSHTGDPMQTPFVRADFATRPDLYFKRWACGLAAGLAACLSLNAQADDEIATDRPDFVESSDVVGPGRFQLETGFSQERDKSGGTQTTVSFTPTLLRIGLNKSWELRFETDGYLQARSEGPWGSASSSGMADIDVGLKWHMQDGNESRNTPGIAWLFHATLPSGAEQFRGKGVRPSVRMVAEWELPQGLSAGVMPGVVLDQTADGTRFTSALLAATVAKSWTEQWRSFIELSARQLADEKYGGNVYTLDTGVAYLINRNTQLDVYLAHGLNDNAPDTELGVGLSMRF